MSGLVIAPVAELYLSRGWSLRTVDRGVMAAAGGEAVLPRGRSRSELPSWPRPCSDMVGTELHSGSNFKVKYRG